MFLFKNDVRTFGLMADAPPTVAVALCVGEFVVPKTSVTQVADDGIFVNVDLVELSKAGAGYSLYMLLWEHLGVSDEAVRKRELW